MGQRGHRKVNDGNYTGAAGLLVENVPGVKDLQNVLEFERR